MAKQDRSNGSSASAERRRSRKSVRKKTERKGKKNGKRSKDPQYKSAVSTVRNMILSGELGTPGNQINEQMIQDKFEDHRITGIGNISIRRALLQLDFEGLVKIRSKRGTFIRIIGPKEIGQLVRTRSVLEELFVCTLARASSDVTDQLDLAKAVNRKLDDLADRAAGANDKMGVFSEALDYDMNFHDALAVGAGYPDLTKDLRSVRYRLRLAQKYVELKPETLRAIARDHDAILDAIRPRDNDLCGDVVRARLAMKIHLRNAVERLGVPLDEITREKGYENDPILDLPAGLSIDAKKSAVPFGVMSSPFGVLRALLELVVAAELGNQPDAFSRMDRPKEILAQMRSLADEWAGKKIVPNATKLRFVNLDRQFHGSIAYVSGLSFAQDAIMHIWLRMYADAKRSLNGNRMTRVVDEHQAILREIMYFSQKPEDSEGMQKILEQVRDHFIKAHERAVEGTNVDKKVPGQVEEFLKWFLAGLSGQSFSEMPPQES